MTVSYEEARKRVAVIADAFDADATFGSDLLKALDYGKAADCLRSILAGPPEPSEEEVVFEIMTDPAYLAEVRDEQQTWLAEHIVQIIQKARRA